MKPERGSSDSTLSDARRSLIHRYMTAETEPAPQEDADEPIVRAHSALAEPLTPPIELPPLSHLRPEPAPAPVNGDVPPAAAQPVVVPPEQPRRGRPRGRKQRRQVHFHVDADEDRLLLAAARQFGSQQKGLIAALRALQEVVSLREQVGQLHAECERQRGLLAQAEALFADRRQTD